MSNNNYDLIVAGGGAAGFFAAINCAINFPHFKIAILEKHDKVLQKVLVSGGGRCNVTHNCIDNKKLVKNYPRGEAELISVINTFNVPKTINWFKERGIQLHAEKDGRMFPTTNNSRTIIDCFINETEKLNISVLLKHEIKSVEKQNEYFLIETTDGEFSSEYFIATIGGFHKLQHYQWLQQLGHSIVKPIPSLFTFNIENHKLNDLMGVSVNNAIIKIVETKQEFAGHLLITHWGFSGPAIIKLSAFAAEKLHELQYNYTIAINWVGEKNNELVKNNLLDCKESNHLKSIQNALPYDLPKRLWHHFFELAEIDPITKWAEISNKKLNKLSEILCNSLYTAKGKTTYKEEFVTCGGVSNIEIDFRSMQSKKVPNLFFAGEVINVDGITGGFNFQAAWSTAYVAAKLSL